MAGVFTGRHGVSLEEYYGVSTEILLCSASMEARMRALRNGDTKTLVVDEMLDIHDKGYLRGVFPHNDLVFTDVRASQIPVVDSLHGMSNALAREMGKGGNNFPMVCDLFRKTMTCAEVVAGGRAAGADRVSVVVPICDELPSGVTATVDSAGVSMRMADRELMKPFPMATWREWLRVKKGTVVGHDMGSARVIACQDFGMVRIVVFSLEYPAEFSFEPKEKSVEIFAEPEKMALPRTMAAPVKVSMVVGAAETGEVLTVEKSLSEIKHASWAGTEELKLIADWACRVKALEADGYYLTVPFHLLEITKLVAMPVSDRSKFLIDGAMKIVFRGLAKLVHDVYPLLCKAGEPGEDFSVPGMRLIKAENLSPEHAAITRELREDMGDMLHGVPGRGLCYLNVVEPKHRPSVCAALGIFPDWKKIVGLPAFMVREPDVLGGLWVTRHGLQGHVMHVSAVDTGKEPCGARPFVKVFQAMCVIYGVNMPVWLTHIVNNRDIAPADLKWYGAPHQAIVGGVDQPLLQWLATNGLSCSKDNAALIVSSPALLQPEGKQMHRMLEAMGDAALTLALAKWVSDKKGSAEDYQNSRSVLTSNNNLAKLFVANFPAGSVQFVGGVDPSGKVGARAFEVVVGASYQRGGMAEVDKLLRVVSFFG